MDRDTFETTVKATTHDRASDGTFVAESNFAFRVASRSRGTRRLGGEAV